DQFHPPDDGDEHADTEPDDRLFGGHRAGPGLGGVAFGNGRGHTGTRVLATMSATTASALLRPLASYPLVSTRWASTAPASCFTSSGITCRRPASRAFACTAR